MVTAPDLDVLPSLRGRSLLTTHDWTADELSAVVTLAHRFQRLDRSGASTAFLPNELAYAMFFDNSTRTKSAWAGAAARLGTR
jgi:aspartate carbamoyltransferase catalytic subunit